ncbi:C-C motif chemokine 4-like [Scomber scombrus]|uniref:C-C motif chemokine 4-like n=1 Tax=Scomber scombrus TaxID=13677 RepID=A0AAV1PDD3_SCOSC
MWTTLSASRWIFLLTFAVVMLFSVSQVDSYVPIVDIPCCRNVSSRRIERIKKCYEQQPREGCNQHAFMIMTKRNKIWCINPTAKWLKTKLAKSQFWCQAAFEDVDFSYCQPLDFSAHPDCCDALFSRVKTHKGWFCIKPDSPRLKQQLHAKKINCPPVFQIAKRSFEVLDEDDVEWQKR